MTEMRFGYIDSRDHVAIHLLNTDDLPACGTMVATRVLSCSPEMFYAGNMLHACRKCAQRVMKDSYALEQESSDMRVAGWRAGMLQEDKQVTTLPDLGGAAGIADTIGEWWVAAQERDVIDAAVLTREYPELATGAITAEWVLANMARADEIVEQLAMLLDSSDPEEGTEPLEDMPLLPVPAEYVAAMRETEEPAVDRELGIEQD